MVNIICWFNSITNFFATELFIEIIESIINSYKLDNLENSDILFSDNNPGNPEGSAPLNPYGVPGPRVPVSTAGQPAGGGPPAGGHTPTGGSSSNNNNDNNGGNNNNRNNNTSDSQNSNQEPWAVDRTAVDRSPSIINSFPAKYSYDPSKVNEFLRREGTLEGHFDSISSSNGFTFEQNLARAMEVHRMNSMPKTHMLSRLNRVDVQRCLSLLTEYRRQTSVCNYNRATGEFICWLKKQ